MASLSPSAINGLKATVGEPCPCGSGKLFDDCCHPLLVGRKRPSTAEALMRSRFTAHVANDYAYLHRTYQPTARLPYVAETAADDGSIKWTKLIVHSHEIGSTPNQAFVEFSAFYSDEQGSQVLQEKSEFHCEDGQWLYTRIVRSGPAPFKSATKKPGRNDPCPCGSGKKYKHCCLAKS
jgi:SEC-C motif-containing protein